MTEISSENISKYTYRINEHDNEMFVFELTFKKFNEKSQKLRKIKYFRTGQLLSVEDNITYNNIKKIIVSALDVNNPINEINVDCTLNQSNKHTLVLNNNIFIEFYEKNGFLESNYNIIEI
jgi:hypothetical protein